MIHSCLYLCAAQGGNWRCSLPLNIGAAMTSILAAVLWYKTVSLCCFTMRLCLLSWCSDSQRTYCWPLVEEYHLLLNVSVSQLCALPGVWVTHSALSTAMVAVTLVSLPHSVTPRLPSCFLRIIWKEFLFQGEKPWLPRRTHGHFYFQTKYFAPKFHPTRSSRHSYTPSQYRRGDGCKRGLEGVMLWFPGQLL